MSDYPGKPFLVLSDLINVNETVLTKKFVCQIPAGALPLTITEISIYADSNFTTTNAGELQLYFRGTPIFLGNGTVSSGYRIPIAPVTFDLRPKGAKIEPLDTIEVWAFVTGGATNNISIQITGVYE